MCCVLISDCDISGVSRMRCFRMWCLIVVVWPDYVLCVLQHLCQRYHYQTPHPQRPHPWTPEYRNIAAHNYVCWNKDDTLLWDILVNATHLNLVCVFVFHIFLVYQLFWCNNCYTAVFPLTISKAPPLLYSSPAPLVFPCPPPPLFGPISSARANRHWHETRPAMREDNSNVVSSVETQVGDSLVRCRGTQRRDR